MTDKDDDMDWLEAVSGRPNANADPETLREAALVRQAMLALEQRQQAEAPAPRLPVEPLLARLRRDGLLEPAGGTRQPGWFAALAASWQGRAGFALAASLLVAVALIGRDPDSGVPESQILRGAAPQVLLARDPAAASTELAARLRSAGLQPEATRFGDVHTITVPWPAAPTPEQAALLSAEGIKTLPGSAVVIEIRQAATK